MAITITMAYQGWIGVWTASALCLGQNIGTTVTAYIASLGASTNAKRAATAHTLFNVVGSVLVLFLMKPMLNIVDWITRANIFAISEGDMHMVLPTFLATFHTLFNVFNTIVFFPFVRPFASLIEHIIPEKKKEEEEHYQFKYIAGRAEAPEFYLIALKNEVKKLGLLTKEMFLSWADLSSSEKVDRVSDRVLELKKSEERADDMQDELTSFSILMLQNSQSPTNADELHKIIRVIDELESITDSIYNLSKLTEDRFGKGIVFTKEERDEISSYRTLTGDYVSFVVDNLDSSDVDLLNSSRAMEEKMDSEHKRLSNEVQLRLENNKGDFRTQLLILEVERNLEHIGDYLLNISETLAGGKTSDHED